MGVMHIAVFGSAARSQDGPESDIDLLVTIAPDAPIGLLELVRMERFLSALLGRNVDLVELESMKPALRTTALKDQVIAF